MYIRNLIYGNEYIMPVYFLFGLWLYVNIQLQKTNIVHTTHMCHPLVDEQLGI